MRMESVDGYLAVKKGTRHTDGENRREE